MMSEGRNRRAS